MYRETKRKAVLVVEVADNASLLKTKLTQAQIDELG